jgi:hypothetical protein
MEQLLNNTPIQWVQVTDPSTGRVYYTPSQYIYTFNNSERLTDVEGILIASASYAITASYALNGGTGGSTDTGSLLTTASFLNPNLEFEKGNKSGFAINLSFLTVTSSLTASFINGGIF